MGVREREDGERERVDRRCLLRKRSVAVHASIACV